MEDWARVVLYGTYDGFTFSTFEPPQTAVRLDGGERVEIPSECVISADQIVKKDKIKLRDVIKRIKDLDVDARNVWLNEILNELGSDFGLTKYQDGYDQGKLEGEWVGQQLKDADKIRQELKKPTVQQFVADWYEENKDAFETKLFRAVDSIPSDYWEVDLSEFEEWLINEHTAPFQTLVNMHQFGYEIEEEKRHTVVMPNVSSTGGVLTRIKHNDSWIWIDTLGTIIEGRTHTRKELEQAGFGWVFDCPGIEIEEVE